MADALALDHPDVPWTPPANLPSLGDLRSALSTLQIEAAQATPKHVTWCLAKLMLAFEANTKSTAEETKARAAVWMESCGDLGDALWNKATLEAIRSSKWMPKPSEFRAYVADELAARAKRLERCRAMLRSANAAANETAKSDKAGPIKRPPTFDEILEEQRTRPGLTDAQRTHIMAHTERSRAYTTRTPMAGWAWEWFAKQRSNDRESAGAAMRMVAARSSPSGKRLAELARARREGEAVIEARPNPHPGATT